MSSRLHSLCSLPVNGVLSARLLEVCPLTRRELDQRPLTGCVWAQSLLRELLGALPAGNERRAQVLEAYGDALAARNLTEDAALAYLAAGRLEQALAQYKVAGQWRMAFVLAGKRPSRMQSCAMPGITA